jgi:hypothetical protein
VSPARMPIKVNCIPWRTTRPIIAECRYRACSV